MCRSLSSRYMRLYVGGHVAKEVEGSKSIMTIAVHIKEEDLRVKGADGRRSMRDGWLLL
jgi:hypothetical protein